jgi:hypothetical protein
MSVWRQATVCRVVDEFRVRSERDRVLLLENCDAKEVSAPRAVDRQDRKGPPRRTALGFSLCKELFRVGKSCSSTEGRRRFEVIERNSACRIRRYRYAGQDRL